MSARFAGARSLGDRRRRRLAQDADRHVAEPTARKSPTKSAAPRNPASEPSEPAPVQQILQPRDSLIPFTPWKVWAIAIVGLSMWGLMLWVGQSSAVLPAFHEIVKLENGPFARFFSTLCLLATMQLSAIILWHRIRSKKDFSGRYRVWFLSTAFWALNCFCMTTGTHLVWSRSLLQRWPVDMWHAETFYWLVPNAVAYLAVHRLLQLEMHLSRASRLVWDAAWWAGAMAAMLLIVPAAVISNAWYVPLFVGSSTLWQLLSAIALLAHARFVIHITNEAAPRKPPRLIRVMKTAHTAAERIAQVIPRPKFLSRSVPVDPAATTDTPPVTKAAAKESPAAKKAQVEQPRPSARPAEVAKPAPAAVKPATEPPKPVRPAAVEPKPEPKKVEPPAPAPVAPPAPKANVRFDPPQSAAPVSQIQDEADESDEDDDDSDTSNLSRKERRRLKKQARQRR